MNFFITLSIVSAAVYGLYRLDRYLLKRHQQERQRELLKPLRRHHDASRHFND